MNLDSQKFKDYMDMYFRSYWNKLNQYLKESNAVIAGGAVLAAYSNDYVNDLDVYIYASKAVEFVNALTNDKTYKIGENHYLRPSYDKSFFLKNNIIARFKLIQNWIGYESDLGLWYVSRRQAIHRRRIFPDIDIMIIADPPHGSIRDVVTNFDLSFCETWYDAQTELVLSQDVQGVLTKTGTLKQDYTDKFLLYLNNFSLQRLRKYIKKGYKISYASPKTNTFYKQPENLLTPEEWVVYKLYNWIVFTARYDRKKSLEIICTYPLPTYTLKEFRGMLPDLVLKTLPPSFLVGIRNNKDLFMKILVQAGVRKYPPHAFRRVQDTLNITMEDISDYYRNRHTKMDTIPIPDSELVTGGDGPSQSEIDAFQFEEADDMDESILEGQVHQKCHDIFSMEDEDIEEYLDETNTILLINKGSNQNFDIMCYTKDYINHLINNKENWFYECTGPEWRWKYLTDDQGRLTELYDKPWDDYDSIPYVRMPIDSSIEGINGFIPLIQLKKLLQSDDKIYYIYTDESISHTISYLVSWGMPSDPDGTSRNHCQSGSAILISKLKTCTNAEKCLKSIAAKIAARRVLFGEDDEFAHVP